MAVTMNSKSRMQRHSDALGDDVNATELDDHASTQLSFSICDDVNDADGDGDYDELEIEGCTDSEACNYDASALT